MFDFSAHKAKLVDAQNQALAASAAFKEVADGLAAQIAAVDAAESAPTTVADVKAVVAKLAG